jgi:hypothetical protein
MKPTLDRDPRAPDTTGLIPASIRFPRLRRMRRCVDGSPSAPGPVSQGGRPPLLSVRAIALLALIVVIAILAFDA